MPVHRGRWPLAPADPNRRSPRADERSNPVTRTLPALGLAVAVLCAPLSMAGAAPMTFTLDKAHTEVGFDVTHFFTKVHGRFTDFTGTIVADAQNVAASSVQVTIRDSSVFTANEMRDRHLRTADFFWADKYPLITFKSTKVVPGKDAKHFQVVGDLTIRGVTKPVTLDAEFLGMGPVGISGKSMGTQAGFHATTTINRQDFGIVWNKALDQGGMMLADEVTITLDVAAMSTEPPPSATK
jgi:polyisoprenoid-binding protein YceI